MHDFVARISFAAALLSLCLAGPATAGSPPLALTECGGLLKGSSYILTGDLSCPGIAPLTFGSNVTLDLNGFTLSVPDGIAVNCLRKCTVNGPGRIEALGGVYTARRTVVSGVTLVGTPILPNAVGIGIHAAKLFVENTTVENFSIGITATNASIASSSITGNGESGMEVGFHPWSTPPEAPCGGGKLRLVDSVVTGNVIAPRDGECGGANPCADIASCRRPRVDELSSCGTSLIYEGANTWSACDLD